MITEFILTALPILLSTATFYLDYSKARRLDETKARYTIRKTSGEKVKLLGSEEELIVLLDYAQDLLPHVRSKLVRHYTATLIALITIALASAATGLGDFAAHWNHLYIVYFAAGIQSVVVASSYFIARNKAEMQFVRNVNGILDALYTRRIAPHIAEFNGACEGEDMIQKTLTSSDKDFGELLAHFRERLKNTGREAN